MTNIHLICCITCNERALKICLVLSKKSYYHMAIIIIILKVVCIKTNQFRGQLSKDVLFMFVRDLDSCSILPDCKYLKDE